MFSDPRFALDPTDPQFRKTPGLSKLLDEGQCRISIYTRCVYDTGCTRIYTQYYRYMKTYIYSTMYIRFVYTCRVERYTHATGCVYGVATVSRID